MNPERTQAPAEEDRGDLQPAPYQHRFVQAGALRLHYLDYGSEGKPTLLCIHGSAASGHWYDYVASGFTADYHVLALDLRGHGDSDAVDPPAYRYPDYAGDIERAVAAIGLTDFVLMGHSMGGMVSLMYTSQYPGRVRSLIIIDTSVNLSAERIGQMRDIGSKPGTSYATKEEIVSRYRLRPGQSSAAPNVVRHIASHSCKQLPDGTWRYKFDRAVYGTREVFDGRPLWSDVKVPALLVKGDRSPRIDDAVFADVKARCPQAELVEVADADHHVTLDNPRGFVAAVQPFLARRN